MLWRFRGHVPVVTSEHSIPLPPYTQHRRGFLRQTEFVTVECRCGCNKKERLEIEYVSPYGLGRSKLTPAMDYFNREQPDPFDSDSDFDEDKPFKDRKTVHPQRYQVIDLTDE